MNLPAWMVRVLALVAALTAWCGSGAGSEVIALNSPGGTIRGTVSRVTRTEVVLRDAVGREQTIPLVMLKPREVLLCRMQVLDAKDAAAHFELGEYCLKNSLAKEADDLLRAAARLAPDAYRDKVEALLGGAAKTETKPAETKAAETKTAAATKDAPEKAVTPATKDGPTKAGETAAKKDAGDKPDEGEGPEVEITLPNGRKIKVPAKFAPNNANVPPKSPEQMKKFLTDRLAECKKLGGTWVQEETPHFYLFTNLKPQHQAYFKDQVEKLYKLLCDVLQHKEGDPLWNNKCPIYFIEKRSQFNHFAVEIDKSPGAQVSGGYFAHQGREVHIVIPLYDFMNERDQLRHATNTLFHEGTHAFLQLVGNNVMINKWLHEGLAQFIEFWYDPKNNPERNNHINVIRQLIQQGDVMGWEEGKMRPMGGGDRVGYAFAWTRATFLYYAFLPDKQKLPKFIRCIKDGKTEEQACKETFGREMAELETIYQKWLKENSKTNFRF